VVAAAVVIAVSVGGSRGGPSVDAAAKLAFVSATQPAPAAASAHYLDVSYGGVIFPNYASLHAVATGQLAGRIGGRPALTVYYRLDDGSRLSYTVFSGRPVPRPTSARLVRYDGVWLHVYRLRDGLSVVTLVRHGRTCVLAARTPEDVVLGLAAEPVLAEHV
jgi:acid phosphatase class B